MWLSSQPLARAALGKELPATWDAFAEMFATGTIFLLFISRTAISVSWLTGFGKAGRENGTGAEDSTCKRAAEAGKDPGRTTVFNLLGSSWIVEKDKTGSA